MKKKIIVLCFSFLVAFPFVSYGAQEPVTVEYVEQVRQQIINYLLEQIALLQAQVAELIANQATQNVPAIGSVEIPVFVDVPIVVEEPKDTNAPKILYTTFYNSSGRGGEMFVGTDEPSKVSVYYVNRNNQKLINANAFRNSWDDLVDEAYKEELAGNGGSYQTQSFATSTKLTCFDAGMTDGERYILRFEAVDESGNVGQEQYLRGKKYNATIFCSQ